MFVANSIAGGSRNAPDRHRLSALAGILFAMVAVMSLGTQAAHAQDWASIAGDERRIVFYAPNLSDKTRRSHARVTADKQTRQEVSIWRNMSKGKSVSGIFLSEILGDRHYRATTSLRKVTKTWNFFNGRNLRFGKKHSTGNKVDIVYYIIVTADKFNCIIFHQYWGIAIHDGTSAGTSYLEGYYCVGENEVISDQEAKWIVRLIGVKGVGVPDRPPAE